MALAGEVVVVTGGSRGIGRAIVHRSRADGARVAALDLTAPDPTETLDTADLHLECDVTDEHAVAAAIERVSAALGAPSVLVNNAGVNVYADPGAMPSEEWDAFFALDLKAGFLCSRAVLGGMRAARHGAIINVSSIHALHTARGYFPYAAAKAGLLGLTRSLAPDLAADGIRVNAVCPGLIGTRLSRESLGRDPEAAERLLAAQPLERMGEPAEVAAVVAFLASADASFVTGATIMVDGGLSAKYAGA
jgi:NAD(P)-dependent dehydrogenase (short-subunit alcohol dehydrogenase family)